MTVILTLMMAGLPSRTPTICDHSSCWLGIMEAVVQNTTLPRGRPKTFRSLKRRARWCSPLFHAQKPDGLLLRWPWGSIPPSNLKEQDSLGGAWGFGGLSEEGTPRGAQETVHLTRSCRGDHMPGVSRSFGKIQEGGTFEEKSGFFPSSPAKGQLYFNRN